MIIDEDPNVYDNNDYTPRLRLEQDDPNTGQPIPATGITDLDVWIAATPGGAEIDSSLKVRAVEMTGLQGTYRISINGGDIHTKMATAPANYDGKDVYIEAMNAGRNVAGSQRVKFYKIRRVS